MKPKISELERVAKSASPESVWEAKILYFTAMTPQTALALIEALKTARGALEKASKRSTYPWSDGGTYTAEDCIFEGRILLAQKILAALDEHFDWTDE